MVKNTLKNFIIVGIGVCFVLFLEALQTPLEIAVVLIVTVSVILGLFMDC